MMSVYRMSHCLSPIYSSGSLAKNIFTVFTVHNIHFLQTLGGTNPRSFLETVQDNCPPPSPHLPCPVSKTVLYSEPCQPAVLCITRFEPGTVLLPTTQPILLSASEGGRFPNPDILQCYTMTRQRPRMIVGDARFEPKTSLPEQTVFKSLDRPHVLIPMRGSLLFCHCRPSFKIIY